MFAPAVWLLRLAASPSPPPGMPRWGAAIPDATKPAADLPLLSNKSAITVYRADSVTGTYNHGPRIIRHDGLFVVSWYAGQQDEDAAGERVLYSTSPDGAGWSSPPRPLFDRLVPTAATGQRGILVSNRPFAVVRGRLYGIARVTQCSACPPDGDGGRGTTHELPSLLRRINANGALGPPVWLARSRLGLPRVPAAEATQLYTESSDAELRADAEEYMAGRLSEKVPAVPGICDGGERSVYARRRPDMPAEQSPSMSIPQLQLVMLLRGTTIPYEWASVCDLFVPADRDERAFAGTISGSKGASCN